MSVDLNLVDTLRERANVSYEEAVDALEKNNNDLVGALIYLEKINKIKDNHQETKERNNIWDKIKNIINKGNKSKFIILKNDTTVLSIPLTLAVIITIFAPYITLLALLIAIITNHKIKIKKDNGEDSKANAVMDNVSNSINNVTCKIKEEF
ncbi:MAG: DUF4342 domain-containing protein [Clostridiaceae bacterium]